VTLLISAATLLTRQANLDAHENKLRQTQRETYEMKKVRVSNCLVKELNETEIDQITNDPNPDIS